MRITMSGSEWFTARPGGLNRYFESLYRALSATPGVDVEATAFGTAPVDDDQAHSWGPGGGTTLSRYRSAKKTRMPDDVGIADRHFSLYGPPARAFSSETRQVIHFQGPWAAESLVAGGSPFVSMMKRRIERARYRTADHLVVLSESFKNILVTEYAVDAAAVSVIAPGVDLTQFAAHEHSPEGKLVVLCVRRLEKRMGIDVLIRAWSSVLSRYPDAELHIVGTGSQERELQALAGQGRGASSIHFLGTISDSALEAAYRSATITVVPSRALEGFGLIALESLASGRAPIVSDCGGLPDAVWGLDSSLVVPAGSVDALGERIGRALAGERPSVAECRAHAETFGWMQAAERHVELYAALISGAR